MLLERRVDGMIFISSELTDLRSDHRHYVRLREEGARLVFVNGSARVARGDLGRGRRARGREARDRAPARSSGTGASASRPAIDRPLPTRDKAEGRAQALLAAGIEPDGLVAHASFSVEGGRRALRAAARERPAGRRRASSARTT